jgi:hypothetical protein
MHFTKVMIAVKLAEQFVDSIKLPVFFYLGTLLIVTLHLLMERQSLCPLSLRISFPNITSVRYFFGV